MSSFHDSAVGTNDAGGTSLATADQLAVTAGDEIVVVCKWEQAAGAIASVSDGVDTYTAIAAVQDDALPFHVQCFKTVATTTGNRTITFALDASRSLRRVAAASFTPTVGKTWAAGAAPAQGAGVSSGTDVFTVATSSANGAGLAVCLLGFGGGRVLTAGAGWTSIAEFDNVGVAMEYRFPTGAGSITADCNTSAGVEYMGTLAFFNEANPAVYSVAWLKG